MTPILAFTLGGVKIYAYQLLLVAALALCLSLGCRAARKAGLSARGVAVFVPSSLFLGFFLAHLFYCLMRFTYALYDMPAGAFFRFWDGNYMLYGGMVGVALAAWLSARAAGFSPVRLMDAIAPFGALMIALVRLAQGLAGQGYGEYLEEESALAFFPLAVYDEYYEAWAWALFMLAALIALLIFVVLLRTKTTAAGDRTLLLLGLYAAAQVVLESLRRDDFLRWGFVRCSQLFSAIVVCFVLVCYCRRAAKQASLGKLIAVWAVFALMVGLCLTLEFAVEQRIAFLSFLSPAGCYTIMACASAVLAGCVLAMRKLGHAPKAA